jgi:hypothetical protein
MAPARTVSPPAATHSRIDTSREADLSRYELSGTTNSTKSLLKLENLDVILSNVVLLAGRDDKLISSFADQIGPRYEENRAMGDARDTAKKKKADEKKSASKKPAPKVEIKAAAKTAKK